MTNQRDLVRAGLALLLVLAAMGSLTRVFVDLSWLPVTLLAAVLSAAVAAVSRALGFGWLGSLSATLVGLFAFTYTQHLQAGPLVPGPTQLAEAWDLFQLGTQQFRDEPAPTVPLDGLLLITSGSAWAITHLTHEWLTRGDAPGLALLAPGLLWAVPLAVPLPPGRTWPQALPFAAACALALLVEGDRGLRDRRSSTRDGSRRAALVLGASLGLVALVAAGVAPRLLPGYDAQAWVDLTGRDDPRGYQPIVDIGDRLKLPEPTTVLSVEADRRTYLRLAALDSFDGQTWKVGPADQATFEPSADALFPADGTLPRETAIAQSIPLDVSVEVLDLENIYVPVPYQPVRLTGDGVDDMVYSLEGGFVASGNLVTNEIGGQDKSGIREGTRYDVQSVLPAPSYEELSAVQYSAASVARWTQLPREYPEIGVVTEQVYAAAGAVTPIDKAFALQEWFTGPESEFVYSLSVDALRGDGALQTFLLETRTGYCEYFATAMAVMLRQSGIPARVSVGFLAGTLTLPADPAVGRTRNTYTVSSTDAHAWVEVLFPGLGWVRFEPTPRSDGAIQQPRPEDLDPLLTERERAIAEAAEQAAAEEPVDPNAPDPQASDRDLLELLEDQGPLRSGLTTDRGPSPVLIVTILVLLALLAWGTWRWRRGAHHPQATPAQRVLLAQRRLHERAAGYGVGRRPTETPREVAARWVAEGRVEPAAAERFTALVEATAFGAGAGVDDGADAEELALQIEAGLRESVGARERLSAPLREPVRAARGMAMRVLRPDPESRD